MKNTGTLVGAPVRPADSEDLYPAAYQSEIKGGHHSRATIAERDAIKAHLREAGMTCYVEADGKTYELDNDLITWKERSITGGTTEPDSGGTSTTTPIISGNFGFWQDLTNITPHITNEDDFIRFKADMVAFVGRAIVYLQGQFSLNATFSGTEITIGSLPINARPKIRLKKYFIVQNIELFLVIETNGDVKILSKDGLNLPVSNSDQPYYIDTFFDPRIFRLYYATRTENFTKNDCASTHNGSVVSFSKSYISIVSQADANSLAATDPNYATEGQSNANANGTCTPKPVFTATRTENFTKNDCASTHNGSVVSFSKTYSAYSQAEADNLAATDPNYATEGQAHANANGTCTPKPVFTATRTENFTKNDCASTHNGSVVSFSKTYSAYSQAEADNLAATDPNYATEGQAYANANGACTPKPVFTATRTENFTRNNCDAGYEGSVVAFSKTYNSYVSQADADNLAATDPDYAPEGQAYANANGTCTELPTPCQNYSGVCGGLNGCTIEYEDCNSGQFLSFFVSRGQGWAVDSSIAPNVIEHN